MHKKLIHPNGTNSVLADPMQYKRLKKMGWRDAEPDAVKEVMDFTQKANEEIMGKIKEAEQCCSHDAGCCKTEPPAEKVEFNTPVETVEPEAKEPIQRRHRNTKRR